MIDKQLIGWAEYALYKTYGRFPVMFDHGQGVKLYDTEDNEYPDSGAGTAVMELRYEDEEYTKTVKEQLHKLTCIFNLFYNQPTVEVGEKLLKVPRMGKVFFTNGGTEVVEGALKIVKRYHYNGLHESMGDGIEECEDVGVDMTGEIIATNHSFHRRGLGALSVTGNAHYQEPFKSLVLGIRLADFNNPDSIKALINDEACAVIMKATQGEGGIHPVEEGFTKGARVLCDGHDLLLILDGIQCSMGRSGEMFTWQHYGVKPGMMTVARALGNGLPAGVFPAQGKATDTMMLGDRGTTYRGNPLVTTGASMVLDLFEKRHMVEHVGKVGAYLVEELGGLVNESGVVKERRRIGLVQGLEFAGPVSPMTSGALLE